MKLSIARQFALLLPETAEMPHHEMTSFRVRGKIFATATPDEEYLHWGRKIVGVRIIPARAKAGMVKDLLRSAWQFKAPKALRGE